jgi:arylsulfatase A-like enzyme
VTDRPNVFLLSVDSLRAEAFEESIGELAAATDGTRFRNAVAPASHTASSVPALATGRFADGTSPDASTGRSSQTAPENAASILDVFREAGYETVVVTDNPLLAASLGEGGDPSGQALARLDEAVPRSVTRIAERAYFRVVRPVGRRLGVLGPYYRPATALNQVARERIADADGPVFCWIHYMDTHSPYWPPTPETNHDFGDYRTAARSRGVALRNAGDGLAPIRDLYRRTCRSLCEVLTSFVRRLETDGLFDPTADVLAVTADHGECLDPDRGVIGHVPAASWESMIHVPLLVARPDWPETTVDGQVSLVDLPWMLRVGVRESASEGPAREFGSGAAGAQDPSSFLREYAFTVARTLGASQYVRGVRSAEGRKLFARRTPTGIDVVDTAFEAGDPSGEEVLNMRDPDDDAGGPGALEAILARRGGPTGATRNHQEYDESRLRALGYLE